MSSCPENPGQENLKCSPLTRCGIACGKIGLTLFWETPVPSLLFLTVFCLFSWPAKAQEGFAPTSPPLSQSVMEMGFGLATVLVVLMACLWLLRKLTHPHRRHAHLRVLGATAVGPKERVVLLDIGPRVLVLGVTPTHITRLDTLTPEECPNPALEPAPPAQSLPSSPMASSLSAFAQRLTKAVERRPHNGPSSS